MAEENQKTRKQELMDKRASLLRKKKKLLEQQKKQDRFDNLFNKAKEFAGRGALALTTGRSEFLDPRNKIAGVGGTASSEFGFGLLDTLTLGGSTAAIDRGIQSTGLSRPEDVVPGAKLTGQIAGAANVVGAAKAGTKLAAAKLGTNQLGKTGTNILTGAVGGAAITPEDSDGLLDNLKTRGQQAVAGSLVNSLIIPASAGLVGLTRNVKKFFPKSGLKPQKESLELAEKVRNTFFSRKAKFGKEFADDIDDLAINNPGKSINIEQPINILKQDLVDNKALEAVIKSAIRKGQKGLNKDGAFRLNQILFGDKSQKANKLISLKESQQIKRIIRDLPTLRSKLSGLDKGKVVDFVENDIPLLDFVDDISKSQLDQFGDDVVTKSGRSLSQINKNFSEKIKSYNFVKSRFAKDRILGQMKSGFTDQGFDKGFVLREINKNIPPTMLKNIEDFQSAQQRIDIAKDIANFVTRVAGGSIILSKLLPEGTKDSVVPGR